MLTLVCFAVTYNQSSNVGLIFYSAVGYRLKFIEKI